MEGQVQVKWSGTFTKGGSKRVFSLNFTASSVDAASEVINGYVVAKEGQGWTLVSNELSVGGTHATP